MSQKRVLSLGIILLAFSMTSAVIWEMSSDPFTVGIAGKGRKTISRQSDLRYMELQGGITFHYTIPSSEKNATLTIFNLSGHLVKRFDLKQGTTNISWPIAQTSVSKGIYIAALKGGVIEKQITISIVK
jgi:flagellar hook assembly protein FlgD